MNTQVDWWEVYFYAFVFFCGLLGSSLMPLHLAERRLLEIFLVVMFYGGLWCWLKRNADLLN